MEKKDFKFSKVDEDNLQQLSDILHLFQHRNKNQHRRSLWWRHCSIFRRQLNGLIEEIKALNATPTSNLERVRKKSKDKEVQNRISQRLDFWQIALITKCQHFFSQVIADGRFAALGLLLIAILAQTCRITGIIAAYEDLGDVEAEKVLEKFAGENWEGVRTGDGTKVGEEDVGVVVTRDTSEQDSPSVVRDNDTNNPLIPTNVISTESRRDKRKPSTGQAKAQKKRRKGENAIDDLFSGLG